MKEKIVKGKIPLLFSRSSFKKAKAVADMASDKITISDKEINSYFSTSGHYCMDMYPTKTEQENYEGVLILEKNLTTEKQKHKLLKYIQKFGHASVEMTVVLDLNEYHQD